jgi:hypothetical protein
MDVGRVRHYIRKTAREAWSMDLGETQVKSVGHGQYECDACGATFSVGDADDEPHTTIVAASGQPLTRIVDVHRKEVHRCRDGRANAGRRSERHDANG